MKSRSPTHIAVVLAAMLGVASDADAQNAASDSLFWSGDSLVTRTVNGRSQSMLIGAVLRHGETSIRADTGVDEGDDIFSFRGNVRIVERADTIDAPYVRYDRNEKVGRASGGVRLSDGSLTVRSPSAIHYSREERTVFEGGVVYEDSAATLSARTAVYFSATERVDFRGAVRLEQDSTHVHADSLTYFRESERSVAGGRVAVMTEESGRATALFADRLERFAEQDSTVAAGGAFLRTITAGADSGADDSAGDTLFVASGMLILASGDADRLIARDSVVVASGRFSSRSDSLVHDRSDSLSISTFTGSPAAWVRRTQITADTIRTSGTGNSIRRIDGRGGVFVASFDSLTGRIQQMSGRTLTARLRRDTLRSILVGPNARGIFFQERAADPETAAETAGRVDGESVDPDTSREERAVGATVASADSLRLYFSGGDVDSLAFVGGVEGAYYTPNLISRVSDLEGYSWTPELAPDIRHIRTSFRELMSRRVTMRENVSAVPEAAPSDPPAQSDAPSPERAGAPLQAQSDAPSSAAPIIPEPDPTHGDR